MHRTVSRLLAATGALMFAAPIGLAQGTIAARTPSVAPRAITALQVSDAIRIDGVLDDDAWRRATPASGFTQSEPREGQPATEPTEVMVAFDDQFLYIGARMRDSDPRTEIVNDIRKDFREDDQDDFEVIIDTFRDRRNGYVFIVNPEGGRVDRQIANEGRDINSSWDAVWDVKTRRGSDGWTAEFRIPFRTLRFDPGMDQSWGINFSRRIRRKNEVTFWAPVPRAYNLMRLSMAGDVTGLHPGKSGRDIRIKPYVLNTALRELGTSGFGNEMNAGVDAKVALTRGLTLDLTARPDFAQVEADEQQVNLTQFAQFFPEKREAFLENAGLFYVGDAARQNRVFVPATPDEDNLLFFSRRIGIRDDRKPLEIDAGARLTGVAGGFGIGLINMQVRGDEITDANNYTALRLRKNVGHGSDVGVLYMQRQSTDNGGDYNRVAGVDANIRFFGALDWNSYLVTTRTPGVSDEQYAARTSVSYEANYVHGKIGVLSLGENFSNDLGFYRRTGVKKWLADIGLRPRPEALRRHGIRELHPHITWDLYTDQQNHMVQKRLHTGQSFFFENGAVVEFSYNPQFNLLEAPLVLSPDADPVPAGPYGWNEFGILANTDLSRPLSLQSRWTFGGLYNGSQKSVSATLTWRPNFRLRVSGGVQRTDGRLDLPDGTFVNAVYTLRANYSFTPGMFVDALSQYDPTTEQLNANVRFNLIHHPLSDLFIVYNDQRFLTEDAPVAGRSIAVKFTQMWSF
jgi:uncharacterized protein DUF5916/cellulose/xylan binding protein with CBM9 domain